MSAAPPSPGTAAPPTAAAPGATPSGPAPSPGAPVAEGPRITPPIPAGPGDLFVDIAVRPHLEFVRRGPDVHAALELGYPDLALGGTFTVPTIHGEAEIEIAAGAEPGAEVRLRGKGVQRLGRRGHGDHVVHLVARPPRRLALPRRRPLRASAS